MSEHLDISGLTAGYDGQRVLDVGRLTVGRGEFLSVLGPSGCGKTTLLNTLAGFVRPQSGSIRLDGEDVTGVPPYRRGLGLVFQNYALFPHLSVADNVAYGLKARKVPKRERAERVEEALRLVSLEAYMRPCGRSSCPAGSSSASRWPGRSRSGPRWYCWTNHCPIWTRSCAARCGWSCGRCSSGWASRWCS